MALDGPQINQSNSEFQSCCTISFEVLCSYKQSMRYIRGNVCSDVQVNLRTNISRMNRDLG